MKRQRWYRRRIPVRVRHAFLTAANLAVIIASSAMVFGGNADNELSFWLLVAALGCGSLTAVSDAWFRGAE